MRGRKPEIVAAEGKSDILSIIAPDWLADEARAEWNRVMPILTERRILTDADLGNLENYCVAIGKVRGFEADFQAETDTGLRLKLFRAQDKAMATARQLGAELGLTPVSRSRPAVREKEEGDDTANPLAV